MAIWEYAWKYGNMKYGSTEEQKCGKLQVCKYRNMEVWAQGNIEPRKSGSVENMEMGK